MIQRFYDVAKGKILLDGRPISDYDVRHLRRHIGVVAQDNILFSASILENIVYGMGQGHLPEASMEDVKEACDMANVSEFLETFPNGVHTFVGEKGVKLSGGQKQRLAIARAIIRKPTILLLDEATSNLDSVNEKEVQAALDAMLLRHKGVAVVIAHRLTTCVPLLLWRSPCTGVRDVVYVAMRRVKNCTKIIVMEGGKKVEEGSHKELMSIDVRKEEGGKGGKVLAGHYHHMWDTQMGEETFADASLMSEELLQGKMKWHEGELDRLRTESEQRTGGGSGGGTAEPTAEAAPEPEPELPATPATPPRFSPD